MNQSITPLSFIYAVIKPYRKCYIFLCLAPIANGFILASIYAIKIIVDTVSGDVFTCKVFAIPLSIFFVLTEVCSRVFWLLHNYSEYKLIKDIYIKPKQIHS